MDYMTTKIPGLSSIRLRAKNEKHNKYQEKMLIRDLPLVYGLFAIGISSGIPIKNVIFEISKYFPDVLPALDSLHRDSKNKIRRESDSAIKKLPVTMLFPLVVCILPAFLLLSVIPILINGFFNIGF